MIKFIKYGKPINKVVKVKTSSITSALTKSNRDNNSIKLYTLAKSVKENGMISPILVKQSEKGECQLITGHRRLEAAKLAGLYKVPCIFINTTSKEAAFIEIIDNLENKSLNYFEQAEAIKELIYEYGVSFEEAECRLNIQKTEIQDKLAILNFSPEHRRKLLDNNLTQRHAQAIKKLQSSSDIDKAIHYIAQKKLSAIESEEYINNFLTDDTKPAMYYNAKKNALTNNETILKTINIALSAITKAGIKAEIQEINNGEYVLSIKL